MQRYRIQLAHYEPRQPCRPVSSPSEAKEAFAKFASLFSDYQWFIKPRAAILSGPGDDGVVTVDAGETIHRLSSWVFVGDIRCADNHG